MIADRTCRAVSFLAARVKSRLRFAAPPATKRGGHWRTGRSGCGASEQTVSDGSWPVVLSELRRHKAATGLSEFSQQAAYEAGGWMSTVGHLPSFAIAFTRLFR